MTDNELIEEFYVSQGGKPSLKADIDFYESDWNMLMAVVEKISFYILTYPEQALKVCECKVVIGIHYLRQRIIEFIKWYNENANK